MGCRSSECRRRGDRHDPPARAAIEHLACELSACRVDVLAAGFAHGGHDAGVDERFLERQYSAARAGAELRPGERIERNEIQLAGNVTYQRNELRGVFGMIVYFLARRSVIAAVLAGEGAIIAAGYLGL